MVAAHGGGEPTRGRGGGSTRPMRIRIIVNPISGRGRGRRLGAEVADLWRRAGHAVELLETARAGDARQWAGATDVDLVGVCGGDGTVNEVLNGLAPNRTLTILPAGTGNVLAKEFRLPRTAQGAADLLTNGVLRKIDLGDANGRKFAFIASAGIDAEVVRRVTESRKGKFFLAAYLPVAWRSLKHADAFSIDVEADGACVARGARYVASLNVSSYGGPIRLIDKAAPDDGWLDLVVLREPLRGRLLRVARALLAGSLDRLPDAIHLRARNVTLNSAQPIPWQADGDAGGMLPLKISLEPGACSLLLPPAPA